MGRTERAFVLGSIAVLLALTALGAAAASDAADGATSPSSLSASPVAFAERQAGQGPGLHGEGKFGHAVELMLLVAACGIVVAFYSAKDAGRGGKRVLMRIRRR
jgi:hypothetical protein